ncbi:MAG: glycosyltransferase family 4 protein [candidate division WOR-3 bacterium]
MSVCMLTSVHPLTDSRIFHKQAQTLLAAGYRLTLAGPATAQPLPARCSLLSIVQLPIPAHPGADRRPLSILLRWLVAPLLLLMTVIRSRCQICHIHDPELLPLGLILKTIGYRVIYDVHEDYPQQILSKHYLPQFLRRPIAWLVGILELVCSRLFDHTVCATESIARRFPQTRASVVRNLPDWSSAQRFRRDASCPSVSGVRRKASFTAVHLAGTLTEARGITSLVQAMGILAKDLSREFRLLLAGRFVPESYGDFLKNLPGWQLVSHIEPVPHEQVWEIYSTCDAGLVCSLPLLRHLESLPVKLFEFMAAGLPVIVSDFPLFRRIVRSSRCGLCVDPLDPSAIARVLQFLARHPVLCRRLGENGRRAVAERYNWTAEGERLLTVYRKLLNPRTGFQPALHP